MKSLLFAASLCASALVYANPSDSSSFYFLKGIQEKQAKRYQTASSNFEKAIQFNPNYIDALIENGNACLEMRRAEQAKSLFLKVYQLAPSNNVAIKELTKIYFNFRQYEKAIEFAQKCKDCPDASRIIGLSYYQLEDYPSAESALKNTLNTNPNDAELMYTLGRMYTEMEEYKKAVPYYEKAVKLPEAKPVWMYELAIMLYEMGDYAKATAAFIEAADHGYAQTADFNENFGYASLYSGDYERGEKLLTGVWSKKPGNKDILRSMAEILFFKKQFDRSLYYCQKLMELDSKDGKALYQAGLCFQKKGEKDRGQAMCDKAIELDPSLESLRRKKDLTAL